MFKYHQFPEDGKSLKDDYDIDETNLQQYYEDIDDLHNDIWRSFIIDTLIVLQEDPQFATFTVREQLLAFYYTHLEVIKSKREFIQKCDELSRPLPLPDYLESYKNEFLLFAESLVKAGMETGEVADRKIINRSYSNGLWLQLIFVIKFWLKDESPEIEKTDAAIEKAVTVSADLVRPGPLDSIVDFAKFIYRNRK